MNTLHKHKERFEQAAELLLYEALVQTGVESNPLSLGYKLNLPFGIRGHVEVYLVNDHSFDCVELVGYAYLTESSKLRDRIMVLTTCFSYFGTESSFQLGFNHQDQLFDVFCTASLEDFDEISQYNVVLTKFVEIIESLLDLRRFCA